MTAETASRARIVSLDQFRGYTVAAMFLVNFIGSFAVVPAIFKHHNTYCSFADTVMPQFFFAVGFAYRLTFLRRRAQDGTRAAVFHALRRNLALVLLGLVIYNLDNVVPTWRALREQGIGNLLQAGQWSRAIQTLVHIGLTGFWVLPVIGARPLVRAAFLVASCGAHLLLSHAWYYQWLWSNGVIDGGPLGFMTWTIPVLVGSLAYDAVVARGAKGVLAPLLAGGLGLAALGYGFGCLTALQRASAGAPAAAQFLAAPPFTPPWHPNDLWTMSQKAGSISYLLFSAGFSLVVYALCVYLCDMHKLALGVFDALGQNALAAYILHDMVDAAVSPFAPRDAPLWYVLAAFAVFFGVCWLFVAYLNRHRLFLRL